MTSKPATQDHWEQVYGSKDSRETSWFEPSPKTSLLMIDRTGLTAGSRSIDVGGGASSLVDHLLQRGFEVAVLDIADEALAVARARLGAKAEQVQWIAKDITSWQPAAQFDLWHDRAVFHFLTQPTQRRGYVAALEAALRPGGWLVMATFAPDGPERCSGLPVQRWAAPDLARELGAGFELVHTEGNEHATPWGSSQGFTWALFRRIGA
jgi:2-polyprenyl-3-methyl-5-hydroxy-6-metoxy-1,4-benzoquinol methylase